MIRLEFIEKVGPLASQDMKRSKILASLTTAQAILESTFGTSELADKAKALFGIKVNGWTGKTYTKVTGEYFTDGQFKEITAEFRAYNSWEESIADHSNYLLTREKSPGVLRYANIIGETDYKVACRKLQEDGYATDPEYANKLIDIIERYGLTKYDIIEEVKPMSKKVFIGVGHGGKDPGAYKYIIEKNANLVTALACREYLEANGVTVKMSRTTDEDDPLAEVIKECNEFNPDLAIDVHNNAGGGDGFEALVSRVGGVSTTLAKNIEAEVIKLGQNSRGVKTRLNAQGRDYYGFVRETKAPAVIVEGVFVDNATDVKIADTIEEQKAFGYAYARGILKTLGVENKTEVKVDNTTKLPFKVKVAITDLNIRTGAGTNYAKVAVCPVGVFTITEVKSGKGSASGWGKLKSGAGWISLDFARRVYMT